jgi:hypothetical protein
MNKWMEFELERHIEKYWVEIEDIAKKKDKMRIDKLRINVKLLTEYLDRQVMIDNSVVRE